MEEPKPCIEIACEPLDEEVAPETTGAMLKRLADKAGEALREFAAKGRVDGRPAGRHRIQGNGITGVGSRVGGTGQIVARRGYESYSATKPPPWDKKNEGRKRAKRAKASRRINRR